MKQKLGLFYFTTHTAEVRTKLAKINYFYFIVNFFFHQRKFLFLNSHKFINDFCNFRYFLNPQLKMNLKQYFKWLGLKKV